MYEPTISGLSVNVYSTAKKGVLINRTMRNYTKGHRIFYRRVKVFRKSEGWGLGDAHWPRQPGAGRD